MKPLENLFVCCTVLLFVSMMYGVGIMETIAIGLK